MKENMEIKKIKSNLQMDEFYFSECSIEHSKKVKNGDYNADLQREIKQTSEHQYEVILTLTVNKEDLNLKVVANAKFSYEDEDEDTERERKVIAMNTVAIMFPFIRSQVTLLTSQPGMVPMVLPPINTAKLVS